MTSDSVFRLKQLEERTVCISLRCFGYHRSQRRHDQLINRLLSHVRQYPDGAKEAAKDRVYAPRDERNENRHKAGHVLKLFTTAARAAHGPFHAVQAKACAMLERAKLACIADHLTKQARFDATALPWEHGDGPAPQFTRHVRPLLLTVNGAASSGYTPLIEAVHFLQDALRKGRPLGH